MRHLTDLEDMKRLFVLRHGKAEPGNGMADASRSLTERGMDDAFKLGLWTKESRKTGAPLWVSPATRTRQTAQRLCEAWSESEASIHLQHDAYLASDRAWLSWIGLWPNDTDQGWIVGHNPGVSELVERLTDQPVWLPTCGLAEVELHIDAWEEAFAGTGRLRGLFTPKSMLLA